MQVHIRIGRVSDYTGRPVFEAKTASFTEAIRRLEEEGRAELARIYTPYVWLKIRLGLNEQDTRKLMRLVYSGSANEALLTAAMLCRETVSVTPLRGPGAAAAAYIMNNVNICSDFAQKNAVINIYNHVTPVDAVPAVVAAIPAKMCAALASAVATTTPTPELDDLSRALLGLGCRVKRIGLGYDTMLRPLLLFDVDVDGYGFLVTVDIGEMAIQTAATRVMSSRIINKLRNMFIVMTRPFEALFPLLPSLAKMGVGMPILGVRKDILAESTASTGHEPSIFNLSDYRLDELAGTVVPVIWLKLPPREMSDIVAIARRIDEVLAMTVSNIERVSDAVRRAAPGVRMSIKLPENLDLTYSKLRQAVRMFAEAALCSEKAPGLIECNGRPLIDMLSIANYLPKLIYNLSKSKASPVRLSEYDMLRFRANLYDEIGGLLGSVVRTNDASGLLRYGAIPYPFIVVGGAHGHGEAVLEDGRPVAKPGRLDVAKQLQTGLDLGYALAPDQTRYTKKVPLDDYSADSVYAYERDFLGTGAREAEKYAAALNELSAAFASLALGSRCPIVDVQLPGGWLATTKIYNGRNLSCTRSYEALENALYYANPGMPATLAGKLFLSIRKRQLSSKAAVWATAKQYIIGLSALPLEELKKLLARLYFGLGAETLENAAKRISALAEKATARQRARQGARQGRTQPA